MSYFSELWLKQMFEILEHGAELSPRGMPTRELPHYTLAEVNMRHPVLVVPARKLNYKFMAAEAYWILTGDDRVSTIAPYNARIAEFSDNGVTYFGAYGPKIIAQLPYVVECLCDNVDTRQAGLTIWRENPPPTKDLPCTIAVFFHIRNGLLNCHVFMRSSDVWLGIPYDVFNMSMLSHLVCGHLYQHGVTVSPGALWLTAASSHLYRSNWDAAWECIAQRDMLPTTQATPEGLFQNPDLLLYSLRALRETAPGDPLRWWA